MDSNNNASTNNNATTLDIRDVVNFLLSKVWIIALVVLCFAIIAFLWTELLVTEQYSSTTDMFIISTAGTTLPSQAASNQMSNWSIGKQLTKTSSELIMGNYCDYVALYLNAHNAIEPKTEQDVKLTEALNKTTDNSNKPLVSGMSFSQFYKDATKKEAITGDDVRSCIRVSSDDETCIISVTATTSNKRLSSAISNAVLALFGDYINDFMGSEAAEGAAVEDTVKTKISSSGKIPANPSNKNSTGNAILYGLIGAVLICAILIIVFIFDDKIKTPDDVEKQLGLSILGAIPEIDEV